MNPNEFHCASTSAIRELVNTDFSPQKALLLSKKARRLFQNPSVLNLLKQSNQTPGFLLSLTHIQTENLLKSTPELMQFLQDQKWPISEIINFNDPQRDVLDIENVRQLLIDHQVSAETFKNFRQYYSGCRCGRNCQCFFRQKEFVADLKSIAEYRFLLEPIASANAFADLINDLEGVRCIQ